MGNRFLQYWAPLILWIAGIFLVSSIPADSFPQSKVVSKFPLHFTAFFVLFLLFYRLFHSNSRKQLTAGALLLSFSFTLLISFSKECWQLLLPTRFFSFNDVLIDGGAALLGMLAICTVAVADQKSFAGIFSLKRE